MHPRRAARPCQQPGDGAGAPEEGGRAERLTAGAGTTAGGVGSHQGRPRTCDPRLSGSTGSRLKGVCRQLLELLAFPAPDPPLAAGGDAAAGFDEHSARTVNARFCMPISGRIASGVDRAWHQLSACAARPRGVEVLAVT